MMKLELLALLEDSKKIIDLLQRKGVVELTDEEQEEGLQKFSTAGCVSQFEKYLQTALNAQTVLNKYAPAKKSLLDSFSARKELSVREFDDLTDRADDILAVCSDILAYQKSIDDKIADNVRIQAQLDALEPWRELDIPLKNTSTAGTKLFLGCLPNQQTRREVLEKLAAQAPQCDAVEVEVIHADKIQTCVAVWAHESCAQEIEQALRLIGANRPPETFADLPAERMRKYEERIKANVAKIRESTEKLTSLGFMHADIEFVIDYLAIRKEKYDALNRLSISDSCFVLSGYVPQRDAAGVKEQIERDFCAVVNITEVPEEEDPPILLKNNTFAAPVESITEMYSTPSNKDVDPNPVMAFFYYVFFGLMLSDAGYGLIMVIAMLFAKKKLKLEEKTKKTVNMFLFSGIATVFWGVMFGSYFGDIVPVIFTEFLHKPAPRMYVWLEPVNDPMILLLYCFLFGIIHLFAGLAVRFYQLWKEGKRLDAVCDTLFVYLLIGGIAPIGANLIAEIPAIALTIGKYCALAGGAGVVLTSGRSAKNIVGKLGGGLYGLYNTASGYLGDVLSYSRLLALGLSTGVIASVFNMLGTLPSNPVVKAITLTVVFIVGHSVNIAINLIGTYVHTNRLQYVEFFSKFYEGGGRSFTPLSVNTKYFKFTEEKTNG